jgi:hypothetical protein
MPAAVVYRRPNLGALADAIIPLRAGNMGELIPSDRAAPRRCGPRAPSSAARTSACRSTSISPKGST